ncbi:MAG TPA: CHAD domain-containing protein [Bryobacteraceae bacterium]|nr:CHAD domain-containing protein [Bryobacteraceae bacterium]
MSKHKVEWDEKASAAANARRELPPVVSRYFELVRDFLAKDPSPRELHRLRLATKRLRYTLELFRPCYGPGMETRLSELRALQQLLGEVNDSAATSRLVTKSMRASRQRARAVKFLDERAARKAHEFRRHWANVFDAEGRERWWTGYLERQAR